MNSVRARLLKKFVLAAAAAAAAAAALLLALAFFAGLRMGSPLSASSAGPASSRDETAQALSGKTVLDAAFASAPPLPAAPTTALSTALASQLPDDMPVNEVIEALDAQARAGDAQAALRIGAELQRCRQLKNSSVDGFERSYVEQLARREIDGDALEGETQALGRVLERRSRLEQNCSALDSERQGDAFRHHLAAGLRGNAGSAIEVLGGGLISTRDWMRSAEIHSLYRVHAWHLFRIAFEAGHPLAAMEWQVAERRKFRHDVAQWPGARRLA